MGNLLRTKSRNIIDSKNRIVRLRGVNLGGWLMMEGYILHSLNCPEQYYKKRFANALGQKALREFEKSFRDHFIQEKDIRLIAKNGFNCLRVPFHFGLIEQKPYRYNEKGVAYLDRVIRWAQKHNLWVILDLHAAPGAQNRDWHADSLGKADLWTKKSNQDRTLAFWGFLADRYKNNETVAGYDLLNESEVNDASILNRFYKKLIERIRQIDPHHMIFVEGNIWATDLHCLDTFDDDNLVLSAHMYFPLELTFNFVPHLSYPLRYRGQTWNKNVLKKYLAKYDALAQTRSRPIFIGEFGVNGRQGKYNEHLWVKDIVSCFKEFGFHWTYWTYKAVKNNVFPDGLFSSMDNPPWVNRQGADMGMATYPACWPKYKKEMIRSWQTDAFCPNIKVLEVLKDACE
ncbi:MAG: glycoside hydrolase family 5 protein [Candidatus Omnitrophota bacterium]